MEESLALFWALEIAGAEMRVFPVHGIAMVNGLCIDKATGAVATKEDGSGKHPKGFWKEQATTDEATIRAWFEEDPDMNYGVVLGEGVIVVDCDSEESQERFEHAYISDSYNAETGEFTELDTFSVQTSRGYHYYFAGDSRTFKLAPETDLKARGGYVVGPGCRTWTGGIYRACDNEIFLADAPSWICQETRERHEVSGEPLRITKGDRNNQLFMLASHLLGLGIDHDKVEDFVRDINETRSDEPLDDHELETTIFTTMRKYPIGTKIADMVDYQNLDQVAAQWAGQEHASPSRFIEMKSDLELWESPRWLIDGWLPSSGMWQLWAPSYAGKTFLVLDLALSLINHKPWFGREIVHDTVFDELVGQHVPRDHVLYILSEGAFDFRQRIDAWCQVNGGDYDKLLIVRQKTLDLATAQGWQTIVDEFEKDSRANSVKNRIGLIIIDTQSMLLGSDENSNRAMSEAALVLGQATTFIGCPGLLVHHSGKGEVKSSRGASSMVAAMDVVMQLASEPNGVKLLTFDKVKGAKLPSDKLRFLLEESGESAYVRVAQPDDVQIIIAQSNTSVDAAARLLERDGPLPYSRIRDELNIPKGCAADKALEDALIALPRFQVGPDMWNRSPIVALLPGGADSA